MSDIHGCYDDLMAMWDLLIKEADFNPKEDVLGILGDFVDRGPDSAKVVQQLIDWQKEYPHFFVLLGNHEDFMTDCLIYNHRTYGSWDLWWQQGGKETAHSYYPKGMSKYDMAISQPKDHIKTQHLEWMASLPIYHEDEKYFYVHGGVLPEVRLEEQVRLLQEGALDEQEAIRKAFLWARDLFIDSKWDWGKKIIFGHTADSRGKWHPERKRFQPIVMDNKIGIDTAVCPPTSNKLTCVELPSEKIWQVRAKDGYERMIKDLQNI